MKVLPAWVQEANSPVITAVFWVIAVVILVLFVLIVLALFPLYHVIRF